MNRAQKEVQQAHLDEEKRILRQLRLVYGQAQDDCINKIIDLSRRRDMENLQSIIYQKQYQEVLKMQLDGLLDSLLGEEFTSISEYLEKCYRNGYIGTMYDINKQGIPIIMPINQEQVVQALQTDSKLSKSLYDSLGEDMSYLKRSIRAELSRGTANGSTWNEMAEKIAKGMNSPFKKAYNRAVVISRTEGHRIQQKSVLDAQYAAKEKGADIVKQWDATLDNRTRSHHRRLDGQIREVGEKFEIDGIEAVAPGYFGKPKEDCNCRCCLLQRARWALDEEELDELKERAAYFGLDKSKDFEDFKRKYLKMQTEQVAKAGDTGIIKCEKMYRKKKTDKIEPMPKKQLQKIVKAFRKNGGIIQMNTDTDGYLEYKKAEAITYDAKTILLRQNPGRAAVFEELIHAAQFRKGMNDGSLRSRIICEIEAQNKLLRNAKAYKLTDAEIRQTRSALKAYEKQLNEMG